MPKLSCPYYYHRIDGGRLWFRCTGRGSPGKEGCRAARDSERERETGYAEPCLPSFAPPFRGLWATRRAECPRCGAPTGIRVCPCCHTTLSANFGHSASPLIAMVGARGTGKTVYMTVLAHELRTGLRRRFRADVRLAGDAQGGYESPLQWLENNVDKIFAQRLLFPRTSQAINGRREPLVFEWRQEHRPVGRSPQYRTSYLSFYDTAGEDLNELQRTHELEYLGSADALILLLDPFMMPQARDRIDLPAAAITSAQSTIDVVNRVTEKLRSSRGVRASSRIDIPVAVAFAKMDAFFDLLGADHPLLHLPPQDPVYDETAGRNTHEHIRALLHEWGADDIDTHLSYNYSTFRYFGVSALGAPPDYDNSLIEAGGVRPHRVDEPLVWLLSRFDVVPRQERR